MFSIRAVTCAALGALALVPALAEAQQTPPANPAPSSVDLPPITVTAGRGSPLD